MTLFAVRLVALTIAAAAASPVAFSAAPPAGNSSFAIVDAVLTPYTASGDLNLTVVPAMAAAAVAREVDVLLLGGSNGEWPSLTTEERLSLLHAWAAALGALGARAPRLLFHAGSTDVRTAQALAAAAEEAGAWAILLVSPGVVFRPLAAAADGGVAATVALLRDVAAAAPHTPMFYYHYPGIYNVDVSMAAFVPAARAAIPTFRGVKYIDSQFADLATAQAAAAGSGTDFFVQSGFLLPCLPLGCSGTPVFTWQGPFARTVATAVASGNITAAAAAQTRVLALNAIMAAFNGTPAARAVYKHVFGIDLGPVRPPLVDLTQAQVADLLAQLEAGGFLPPQ